MSAVDTARDALLGNPPSAATKPSRQGLLQAFQELSDIVGFAALNMVPYATFSLMNADVSKPTGTLAYVYKNAGSVSDAANGFYQWSGSAWVVATWYFDALHAVLQPYVDAATGQVTLAAAQVTLATAQAAAAATSNTNAASAAANAATAYNAILAFSVPFADYTTGLAAVADGVVFRFYSPDGLSVETYKRVSGAGERQSLPQPVNVPLTTTQETLSRAVSSGGVTNPPGAIIDFCGIDTLYDDGPIPNRVGTPSTDLNLLGCSRPCELPTLLGYGSTTIDATTAYTVTYGVAGEDAALKAIRVQHVSGSGGGGAKLATFTVPPGRWSIVGRIISDSGTPSVQFGTFSPSVSLSAITTSAAWQTFKKTYVNTTDTDMIFVIATAYLAEVDFNIRIDNLRVVPGSADGVASPLNSSPHRNRPKGRAKGSWPSNTVATMQNFVSSLGSTPINFTALSWCAAVNRTDWNASGFGPIFSNVEEASTAGTFFIAGQKSVYGTMPIGLQAGMVNGVLSYQTGMNLNETIIICGVNGPSGSSLYINGRRFAYDTTVAFPSLLIKQIEWLSLRNTNTYGFIGDLGAATIWPRELTPTEAKRACAYKAWQVAAMGCSFNPGSCAVMPIGTSITFGSPGGNPGYAYRIGAKFAPYLQGMNFGHSGAGVVYLTSQVPAYIAQAAEWQADGLTPIAFFESGTNDRPVDAAAATALWNSWKSGILTPLRNAGIKVCQATAITVNPATYNAYETVGRPYLNGLIAADTTAYDAVCNWTSRSEVNVWNSSNFFDDVHPNDNTHQLMAIDATAAIRTLWTP